MTSRAVTSLSRIQFAFCLICMWSFIPLAVAEVEERWQPLNQKPRLLVLTDIKRILMEMHYSFIGLIMLKRGR